MNIQRMQPLRTGISAQTFKLLQCYKFFVLLGLFAFALLPILAAEAATLRGLIKNSADQAPLANANIQVMGTSAGTTSDGNGNFVLTDLAPGTVTIQVSYMGFESRRLSVELSEDETKAVNIALEPRPVKMDELVVTSTKYERTLRDVAMPLSIVNEQRIRKKMPRDVSEAVSREPGLSIIRDGVWGSQVNIRGLSRNNIVMLVDGNRIDTANDLAAGLSMIDVHDIEQVEVIKGAGSSLYGTGAVGGVVNVLTKQADYADNFYMGATVTGGYSSANSSGQGYFEINSGGAKWHAKLSGMNRNAENIRTPEGILNNSRYSDSNLSARLGFRPFKNHELLLNWQQYRGTDIGIPGGNTLFPSNADVRYPRENRDLLSLQYIGRQLSSTLNKVSIKYFMQDILRDVENVPHITKEMPGEPVRRLNVLKILPQATHATQGVQLQTDWLLGRHQLIAGIDAWGKEMDSFRKRVMRIDVLTPDGSVANSIDQVIGERPIPLSSYQSMGVFLQDEVPLWKNRLVLTLGGRYDAIQVENEKTLQPVYVTINGEQNNTPPSQEVLWDAQTANNKSWSGNLGLLFKASTRADLTLTLARSFRSPYLEERYQYIDLGNLVKIGDPNLNPEQGAFADVGLRYWGDRFTFIGNVFYNQIQDMVVEAPGEYEGRNALLKTNVGSAELYGADLGVEFSLYKSISVFGTAAYVHGTDTYVNEPLPLVPPLNGRVGFRGAIGQLAEFECAARLFGTQDRVAAWELETPGYTVFDVYLNSKAFRFGSINSTVYLGIENIFDRAYRDHLSTNRGSISIEPGRNVSLRWQLGI